MMRMFSRWYILLPLAVLLIGGAVCGLLCVPTKGAWIAGGARVLAPLLAVLVLRTALSHLRPTDERRSWALLTGSLLVFAIGFVYWALSLGKWDRLPFPTWNDLLFLIGYLLLWAGLCLRPGRAPAALLGKFVLVCDLLLTLGAGVALAAAGPLYPLLLTSHAQHILAWEYCGVLLATLLCLTFVLNLTVPHHHRWSRVLLVVGAALLALGHVGGIYALLVGAPQLTCVTVATWMVGCFLFVFAALWEGENRRASTTPAAEEAAPPFVGLLLPVAMLIAVCVLAYRALLLPVPPAQLRVVGCAVLGLLALLVVRHLLAYAAQRRFMARLRQKYAELERTVVTDPLTGLSNHRYLMQRLNEELSRAQRYQRPLSLLFTDIDFFKMVNDAHGHRAGDQVLCTVAQVLKDALRTTDVVARYGGEEFVLILPETTLEHATLVGDRLRHAVETLPITLPSGKTLQVTISVGVASYPETSDSIESLITTADEAMNRAKDTGRNRVVTAAAKVRMFVGE